MDEQWTLEQLVVLDAAGIPDNIVRKRFKVFGSSSTCVACAVRQSAYHEGFWPELLITSTAFELNLWRLPIMTTKMNGQEHRLHPSMVPGNNERPEGPPVFTVIIDAQKNNEVMGVRLAAAYWQWLMIEHKPSIGT